jgi:hypothetical protein
MIDMNFSKADNTTLVTYHQKQLTKRWQAMKLPSLPSLTNCFRILLDHRVVLVVSSLEAAIRSDYA